MCRICVLMVTMLSLAFSALALVLSPAAAATTDRSLIVVGRSIGPIELDMAAHQSHRDR